MVKPFPLYHSLLASVVRHLSKRREKPVVAAVAKAFLPKKSLFFPDWQVAHGRWRVRPQQTRQTEHGPHDIQLLEEGLKTALTNHGFSGSMELSAVGPVVAMFHYVPPAGFKAAKLMSASTDMAREMGVSTIRILESVPNRQGALGLEIPHGSPGTVYLQDVIGKNPDPVANELSMGLGVDTQGNPVEESLVKMPHLLVAGASGSGKSMGLNAMILSLLRYSPQDLRFILIDPKMLELSGFNGIPHLLTPTITDMNRATAILTWLVSEMEERYRFMAQTGAKNLAGFNVWCTKNGVRRAKRRRIGLNWDAGTVVGAESTADTPLHHHPHIVVVIDELADLMMQHGRTIEPLICRLAQKVLRPA